MQRIEYTCDWCHALTEPQRMNRLTIRAVVSRPIQWETMVKDARRNIAHSDSDICDACVETLIRGRGPNGHEG